MVTLFISSYLGVSINSPGLLHRPTWVQIFIIIMWTREDYPNSLILSFFIIKKEIILPAPLLGFL